MLIMAKWSKSSLSVSICWEQEPQCKKDGWLGFLRSQFICSHRPGRPAGLSGVLTHHVGEIQREHKWRPLASTSSLFFRLPFLHHDLCTPHICVLLQPLPLMHSDLCSVSLPSLLSQPVLKPWLLLPKLSLLPRHLGLQGQKPAFHSLDLSWLSAAPTWST